MLKGKTVLLGVSGGIAAYKAAALTSALVKAHADVEVIMTANATKFVAPMTFEQLSGRRAAVDMFDRSFPYNVAHISLADKADVLLIAPATANVCAKLAHGIADDMLTTTALACRCPKLIAPSMNTNMYENAVTQDNLEALRRYGWRVIEPAEGRLACGSVGRGNAGRGGNAASRSHFTALRNLRHADDAIADHRVAAADADDIALAVDQNDLAFAIGRLDLGILLGCARMEILIGISIRDI